jgi:4-hydroxy-3-methylbut-2-enyl diphosphate reductase
VNAAVAKAFSLKNVYCLHELVHNEIIVGELKELGFKFVDSVEQVPEGECVVFSAHGVSPAVRELAEKRRLKVVDTTCPFVAKVHEEAKAFVAEGRRLAVIGDRGHAEVEGIAGEGDSAVVVGSVEEARRLELPENTELGVVCQTTADPAVAERIVEELGRRFSVKSSVRTCAATAARLEAVRGFDGDALLVLGSGRSANVRRLCGAGTRHLRRSHRGADSHATGLGG